jgi:hypothetical protein
MKPCKECNATLENNAKTCPECGTSQEDEVQAQPVAYEDEPFRAFGSKEEKARWLRREAFDGTRVFAQSVVSTLVFVLVGGAIGWTLGDLTGLIAGAVVGTLLKFLLLGV